MKKFLKTLLAVVAISLGCTPAFGQYATSGPLTSSQVLAAAGGPVALPGMPEAGFQAGTHFLTFVASGTVSTCTVQLETSANGTSFSLMSTSAAQTCTSTGSIVVTSQIANFVRINVTALSGTGSVTFTLVSTPNSPVATLTQSGSMVYWVPLQACGFTLTTGALAAASTTSQLPGELFIAANNSVLQVSTSAAASAATLDCDITPPYSTSTNKGVTITDVAVFYGYQGAAALSTIAGPTFANVTYSAATGAAAGTVSGALGGSLTNNAGTSHAGPGAVTTTGQCYSEDTSFGTPIVVSGNLSRTTMEYVFNHATASAATYQLCGVLVRYTTNF